MNQFTDRREAGIVLSHHLSEYANHANAQILALPRGGVPVAFEIAKALHLPLDVLIVRKLGVPGHEELAMGAITSGNTLIFNDEILRSLSLSEEQINRIINKEKEELSRREILYRGDRPFPSLHDKVVILVDDGIATGATMRAAIKALHQQKPAQIVVAVPVAALSTYNEMASLVDRFVCPLKPVEFYAVGLWYRDFAQTTDEEVIELLSNADGQGTLPKHCF